MTTALSLADRATLSELEDVIERGLETFVDVGNALERIRDEELYRATDATFEIYLSHRWNMSRARGYQLMESAEIVSTFVDTKLRPTNEGQARALAPLKDKPEKMRAVMAEVVEKTNGRPTARVIREVVERVRGGMKPPTDEIGPDSKDSQRYGRGVTANDFYTRVIRNLVTSAEQFEETIDFDMLKQATRPGEIGRLSSDLRQSVAAINRVIEILDAL